MIGVVGYIIFCIALACYNNKRIKQDKKILHGLNALYHAIYWVAFYLLVKSPWLTLSLPFLGRLFFDSALNTMRGLPLDYVAKNPKSIIDKIEKKIFGYDGFTPKFVYLIIAITLIIIHYAT